MMIGRAYDKSGHLIATVFGKDYVDVLHELDQCPALIARSSDRFKVRIEDEAGSGCWIFVGPPSEAD